MNGSVQEGPPISKFDLYSHQRLFIWESLFQENCRYIVIHGYGWDLGDYDALVALGAGRFSSWSLIR